MNYGEFVEKVKEQTGIEREAADRLAWATMLTLVESSSAKEAWDWPVQFPEELQLSTEVKDIVAGRELERYSPAEFYDRIRSRAQIEYSQAESGAKAVIAVLQEAVPATTLEGLKLSLPADLRDQLFQRAP